MPPLSSLLVHITFLSREMDGYGRTFNAAPLDMKLHYHKLVEAVLGDIIATG
jgi:hypothetical protein